MDVLEEGGCEVMKHLPIILLLVATSLLTGCVVAEEIWMMQYRAKGGYYDRPATQKAKP